MAVSYKVKYTLTFDPAVPLLGVYTKTECEYLYSQLPKGGNNPNAHQVMNG